MQLCIASPRAAAAECWGRVNGHIRGASSQRVAVSPGSTLAQNGLAAHARSSCLTCASKCATCPSDGSSAPRKQVSDISRACQMTRRFDCACGANGLLCAAFYQVLIVLFATQDNQTTMSLHCTRCSRSSVRKQTQLHRKVFMRARSKSIPPRVRQLHVALQCN